MIIEQPAGFGYIKHKLTKDELTQIWYCPKRCGARIHTSANYRDATKALRDIPRIGSNYTKSSQKRVEAKIQAAYDDYVNGTKPLDTLITLAKATEKVCFYQRDQEGNGDTDEILIAHFEEEPEI